MHLNKILLPYRYRAYQRFVICVVSGLLFAMTAHAQSRIIFIGDAGVSTDAQQAVLKDIQENIISDSTTIVFLGNNVYPDGMSLPRNGENDEMRLLRSMIQPLRDKGAKVILTAGNRDWDNSGVHGVERVRDQSRFIDSLHDSGVEMLPYGACPGPIAVPISDSVVMIILNTEWWLYPYETNNEGDDCNALSDDDIIHNLRVMVEQNQDKTILLATHHPFSSYGNRGGKFSWKDHIFPLTAADKNLYLPLPGIGSLYPLFRKSFGKEEDLYHPSYREMIRRVSDEFKHVPNLVQISAHEDGLQVIRIPEKDYIQIVAGIGEKPPFVKKGAGTLFHRSDPGYVIADVQHGGNIHFRLSAYRGEEVKEVYSFANEYEPPSLVQAPIYKEIEGDSIYAAAHPEFNEMGKFGRFWMGENFRKSWAAQVKLPVLRLSELHGGLTPVKLGGGMQTISLRLADSTGNTYTLRSVMKVPDKLVPRALRGTFARNWAIEIFSSQHPYSALMVPPIEQAVGVPHAHPVIGVVAPDTSLGAYQSLFVGKVNLLEEREPLGNSDNFTKAFRKLKEDNDNSFDGINQLKARMVDLLVGDWDRHDDQWRFYDQQPGSGKKYIAVPRDRDLAFNLTEGVLPWYIKHFVLIPHVYGFKKKTVPGSKYYLMENGLMSAYANGQIGYKDWMQTANEFTNQVTDSVLAAAVSTLPEGIDPKENRRIYEILRARRDAIPQSMEKYYRFGNQIVDIRATDKDELIEINDMDDEDGLRIRMRKISKKDNLKQIMMQKNYPKSMTKEIRLYLFDGNDSVYINNRSSSVKLRIVGGEGQKSYHVSAAKKKIRIYDQRGENYSGDVKRLKKNISTDTSNLHYVPTNLYNTFTPYITGGYNRDDGVLFGLGARYMRQRGFRKVPYSSLHNLLMTHSFSTRAYHIAYQGEWLNIARNMNFILKGDVMAPENKQNFFGAGNTTPFDKTGDYKTYYRARFNLYSLSPLLAWHGVGGSTFSVGPQLQYYHFNAGLNDGRFISNPDLVHSFDSAIISKDKLNLGLAATYELDRRDTMLLPTYGFYLNIAASANAGATKYARSYYKLAPSFSFYKSLGPSDRVILADRIGGEFTAGRPAFYQYAYLGGQGNLLGFRKFRFAGQHAVYNNLEMRVVLSDFGNRIFRGQLGLIGFYDVGRVWIKDEQSDKWHNGVGGGIYIAPAKILVIRGVLGYSEDGWMPYAGLGFRF